ncbi:MAG TPA: cobalamin-dependent protein [Thermoanaerobaculia bacterium]|nr:cobalamin-dependent protein [Thermoanaerobaculia bacterium]
MSAETIRLRIEELGEAITERHFARHPELDARYGPIGRVRCREDARFHLQFLAAAIEARSSAMFLDYVGWAKVMLASRDVPVRDLAENLEIVDSVIRERAPDIDAARILRLAIERLDSMPSDVASFLDPRSPLFPVASQYLELLLHSDRRAAAEVITNALDGGASPRDIYRLVFEPVQQEVGRLWQLNRVTVAQEHFASAATQQIMTLLYSRIFGGEKRDRRAVAMCVGGELHEVGLRIVSDLLELHGWQTWYLGANMPPSAAVQMCIERRADILLVSATLTPHLVTVREVIRLFRSTEVLANAKVIVGGRAFRMEPELWKEIGADGYAANADECLDLADRLVS